MTYPQSVQLLIEQWNARVGGLDTLRILADELEACGDERMALACRDAVRWFESIDSKRDERRCIESDNAWFWFNPDRGKLARLTKNQWYTFAKAKSIGRWHAIELYADYPPLGTKRADTALNNYATSVFETAEFNARMGSLLTTTEDSP